MDQPLGYNIWKWVGNNIFAGLFAPYKVTTAYQFGCNTSVIELGYNDNVTISIGKIDVRNLDNTTFIQMKLQEFLDSKSFTFIPEVPNGTKRELWRIDFDPPTIFFGVKGEGVDSYRINVTISLKAPPIGENAIQTGILRIRQASVQQYGQFLDLIWLKALPELLEGGITIPKLKNFIHALQLPILYTFLFKDAIGSVSQPTLEKMKYVDILVKVKPYHKVKIQTPKIMNLNPNQIAAVPITLKNLGNYKDTIGFRVVSKNKDIKVLDPIEITLKPGETSNTIIGIGVPPDLIDFGTLHDIKIEAYSLSNPNVSIGNQTLILKTSGFYLSDIGYFVVFFIIIIFLIFTLFLNKKRKKIITDRFVKPDKPWDVPEEKSYLEKLKKEDKQKFKETMDMMYYEYLSALYSYKDSKNQFYKKSKLRKEKEIRKKIDKEPIIKKEEKVKEEPIKEEIKTEEIKKDEIKKQEVRKEEIEKPKLIVEKKLKPIIKKEKDIDIIRKNRAITRILKDQEKQKKKLIRKGVTK